MFNEIEDFTLGDLFAISDIIGDKYLTDDELAQRSAELLEAQAELDKIIKEQNLDDQSKRPNGRFFCVKNKYFPKIKIIYRVKPLPRIGLAKYQENNLKLYLRYLRVNTPESYTEYTFE